jgi:hypothetical protein
MNRENQSKIKEQNLFNKSNTIGHYQNMVILGLVLSVFIIFFAVDIIKFPFVSYDTIGFIITLGNTRHTVGVIGALLLIPLCVYRIKMAYYGVLYLSFFISLLCIIHIIIMIVNNSPYDISRIYGPVTWTLIQIYLIIVSFLTIKKMKKNTS